MGFELELHLLYPHVAEDMARWHWVAHEALVLGRVTRMEKLGPTYSHVQKSPHERAAICAASVILGKLFERLNTSFAPPIVHLDDEAGLKAYLDERDRLIETKGHGFLIDLYGGPLTIRRPIRPDFRVRHNELWTLSDEAFAAQASKAHPVMDPPFYWESCANLAAWLQDAEADNTLEWMVVQKDPVALAKFRAWRSYLREVSQANARALFLFQ